MRKLIVSAFVSLDGVMQAPGGPDEDRTGGFSFGGWTAPYWEPVMEGSLEGFDGRNRDLLLGRRTYEIFESYWPYQAADDPIARNLNGARKYVASRTLKALEWEHSELLGEDVVAAVQALKAQDGFDLQVIGSAGLVQTLQGADLVDEFHVWTFPVVLGRGKRLFEVEARPQGLRLLSTKTSPSGVVMSEAPQLVLSPSKAIATPLIRWRGDPLTMVQPL